jgi:hypothetical protein
MSALGVEIPIPAGLLIVAAVITAVGAAVQGTVGFGYAIVTVPLLSLLDPRLAPVPQILTTIPLTFIAAWHERRHIDLKGAGWIAAGRLPGMALGALLVALASHRVLDLLIGASVAMGVGAVAWRVRVRRGRAVDFSAGVVSGVTGYVSGIGGPPIAILYRDARGPAIRATLSALFAIGVLATVAGRLATGQITALDLTLGLLLAGPVVAGTWASRFLHRRVEGRMLRVAVLVLSAFAGVGLMLRAIWAG